MNDWIAHRSYKYIKKTRGKNGKWRYWYKLPSKRSGEGSKGLAAMAMTAAYNANTNLNTMSEYYKDANALSKKANQLQSRLDTHNDKMAKSMDSIMWGKANGDQARNEKLYSKNREKAIKTAKEIDDVIYYGTEYIKKKYGITTSYRPHARRTGVATGSGYAHLGYR